MSQAVDAMTEYRGALLKSVWLQALGGLIAQADHRNAVVLIRGERGVGKDLLARVLHEASPRQKRPFIKISCATRPPDRLAVALFGHERDAVKGATRRKLGGVEFAHGGTLFLDEIGALPRALQAPLLRVLREHAVCRLGGREPIRVDVGVVATTTQALGVPPSGGEPWGDSSGLQVIDIQIPPLRERRDEIPALAAFFLARLTHEYGRQADLRPEMLALFTAYGWPGNIGQLEEVVRRLVLGGDPREIHGELHAQLQQMRAGQDTLRRA